MNYLKRNRVLFWLLVTAVIIDIAAVGTILYREYFQPPVITGPFHEKPCTRTFLTTELHMTPAQTAEFNKLKDEHSDTIASLYGQMKEKRSFISENMIKPSPDTASLFSAADELGVLYAASRKLYVLHYFDIARICDPAQQKRLGEIFSRVFCCDNHFKGNYQECGNNMHNHHHCNKNNNKNY